MLDYAHSDCFDNSSRKAQDVIRLHKHFFWDVLLVCVHKLSQAQGLLVWHLKGFPSERVHMRASP